MSYETNVLPAEQMVIGSGIVGSRLTPEHAISFARGQFTEQHAAICELDQDTSGLNMGRLREFAEEYSAADLPIIPLSPDNYNRAKGIISEKTRTHQDGDMHGQMLYEHGLIIAKRDPVLEEAYGPEIIESAIAHEIGHASAMNTVLVQLDATSKKRFLRGTDVDVTPSLKRFGYYERASDGSMDGHLFEEGYAELVRGSYIQDVLGMPRGFTDLSHEASVIDVFSYTGGDNERRFLNGTYGAFLLDQMCRFKPELTDALHEARKDVSVKSEVIELVDSFEPGLYDKLAQLRYNDDGYENYIGTVAQVANSIINPKS